MRRTDGKPERVRRDRTEVSRTRRHGQQLRLHQELQIRRASGNRRAALLPGAAEGRLEGRARDRSCARIAPTPVLLEQTGLGERLSYRGGALTRRPSRRRPSVTGKPLDLSRPGFEISFELRPDATRSARNYVGDLLPDAAQNVREAVMLLTSELVTRAVRQRPSGFAEPA